MTQITGIKGVIRHGNAGSWIVNYPDGDSRMFYVKYYGSELVAHKAACKWLAEKLTAVKQPIRLIQPTRDHSTGHERITLTHEASGRCRLEVSVFDADGRPKRRRIRVGDRTTWESRYRGKLKEAIKIRDESFVREAERQLGLILKYLGSEEI